MNPLNNCECQPCKLLREDTRPFMQAAVIELTRIMNAGAYQPAQGSPTTTQPGSAT